MNKDNITIILTTHPGTKWTPSTRLIESTIQNVPGGLHNNPWIVCCDTTDERDEYWKRLQQPDCLQLLSNKSFIRNHGEFTGLKYLLLQSARQVETEFVLFLEHDWKFLIDPGWNDMIDVFKGHEDVNYIGFNKRENIEKTKQFRPCKPTHDDVTEDMKHRCGHPRKCVNDSLVEPDERFTETKVPLVKSNRWSNNPFIARTSKLQEWCNLIDNGRVYPRSLGVEMQLRLLYHQDCYDMTWSKAHKKWGVYLYGLMNQPAAVAHFDGTGRGADRWK
jgi:hypothetical protein